VIGGTDLTPGGCADGGAGKDTVWLTVDQAADEIDVHRATVYRMIDDGRLAAQKQGKGWRIRAGEVDRFLAGVAAEPPESAVAEVHARHARLARLARLLAWLFRGPLVRASSHGRGHQKG